LSGISCIFFNDYVKTLLISLAIIFSFFFWTGWLGGGGQDQTSKRQTKKKPAKNQDPNKVTFIVLAMSEKIIDQAIAKLESCLDKEVCSSKFNDSIIKNMNDQQVRNLCLA
jgi:hypothetical protein